MTNIYHSFTYKMAAKINWHRNGIKLRHWAAVASQAIYKWQPFSGTLKK